MIQVARLLRFLLRFVLVGVVLVLFLGIGFFGAAKWWQWRDAAKARMTTDGPYTADLESLNRHPLPDWFADAKFGVMIHWGLYSVPGFAPTGKTLEDLLATDYDHAMTRNPYAEDYANAMKDPSSPTAAFHREHYGDQPYEDFVGPFEAGLAQWNPENWAQTFAEAGAGYVVVTAKYADGYSLWPTAVRNPHAPDFHSERDLMGELAAAVRKRGMKFGVYYSGGVDWTFQRATVRTLGDYAYLHYGEDYREYAVAQVRELIERYKPDILWNDISWPTGPKRLYALLADYYNTVPEGVVDDRWATSSLTNQLLSPKPMRWAFDRLMSFALRDPATVEQIKTPKPVPHSDFRTPEYTGFDTVQDKFWQQDRGIGGSFGYNRAETDADYAAPEDLAASLATAAANNGALLLNVGPSGSAGVIVPEQLDRLRWVGEWLVANREAFDGTRPWRQSSATTGAGDRVVFTRNGEDLYAIVLGKPVGSITLQGVPIEGAVTHLASGKPMSVTGSTITSEVLDGAYGQVFKVAGAA